MERYRILLPGLLLQDVVDFKQTSRRICARVMQDERDWQIGHHKVFLKVCTVQSWVEITFLKLWSLRFLFQYTLYHYVIMMMFW